MSPILVLLLSALAVTLFLTTVANKAKKFLDTFPAPRMYPILGNLLDLRNPDETLKVLSQWNAEYGNRFRISVGYRSNMVVLTDFKDLQKVMTSQSLLTKGRLYRFFRSWIGDGLLTATGDKWHRQRKLLTPAFHFKMIESFQQVCNEQSKVLLKIMKAKCLKNEPCRAHRLFSLCSLSIMCEAALGKDIDCYAETNKYVKAVIRQSMFICNRWANPLLQNDFIWSRSELGRAEKTNLKVLRDFINQVIAERKALYVSKNRQATFENMTTGLTKGATIPSSKPERLGFLDLLVHIQASGQDILTDEDIYDETATFTFEGHDTTSAALTWSLYLLAKHPEHQIKVQCELDSIFGADRTSPVTTFHLPQLKYLEGCIKESLRLYPSVPLMTRKVANDFPLDENTVIPRGVDIIISPWLIHRNDKVYPDPEKFDPLRHLTENSSGRHPYAFMPFSAGPRNCVGQRAAYAELKTVLANVFRSLVVDLEDPDAVVVPFPHLICRPKGDISVKFKLRPETF